MDKDLAITQLANLLEGRRFTNIPGDAGGPTSWGVTQETYDGARAAHGLAKQSVQLITWPEAQWIYDFWYWTPAGCGQMPNGLDFTVFQFAVHANVKPAVKLLQEALGFKAPGDVDGWFGPMTLAAVKKAVVDDLVAAFLGLQHAFYLALEKSNPKDQQFAKGWDNRIRRTAQLVNLDPARLAFLNPAPAAPSKVV